MNKYFKAGIAVGAALLPMLAGAQGNLGGVQTWTTSIMSIVNTLVPIAFTLAILAFFYGLAKFIFGAGNDEARASGKKVMIWGLVAIFVMASLWGIVTFVRNQIGIGARTENNPTDIVAPRVTN